MVTPGKVPAACSCGHALDATHMLCCKHGDSAWLLRHNKVQQVLAGFARKQGLAVDQNVRKSFEDAEIKPQNFEPDLIVYFQDQALWGDVSIVEPVAPSNVRGNDNVGAVIVNLEVVKGNAEHAARVRSRAWKAWNKQRQRVRGTSASSVQQLNGS